jgi:hypothetical protein
VILSKSEKETQRKTIIIPKEQKWAGMELTTDEELMVIANTCYGNSKSGRSEFMRMMAVDLSNLKIVTVAQKDFTDKKMKSVQFMRKVKGYDYFLIACKGSVGIVELKGEQFNLLNFFEDLYKGYIFEVSIFENYILPVPLGDNEPLKMIEFGYESEEDIPTTYPACVELDYQTGDIMDTYSHLSQIIEKNPTVRKFQTPSMSKNQPKFKRVAKESISATTAEHCTTEARTASSCSKENPKLQVSIFPKKTKVRQKNFVNKFSAISYFALRSTPSGYLVAQMAKSNDLLVFDKALNMQAQLKAKSADISYNRQKTFGRRPHFSFEGGKMVWFSGKYQITLVDLTNLEQTVLKNNLPELKGPDKQPEPQFVIADFEKSKVLTYYLYNEEGVLVFNELQKEPKTLIVAEKYPFAQTLNALDLTKNKKLAVFGGQSQRGKAYIAGFHFDGVFELAARKDLIEVEASFVNSIAMSKNQDDLMFACTDGPFLVLGLNMHHWKIDLLKIIDIQVQSKKSVKGFRSLR